MPWALGLSALLHLGLAGLAGTAIVEPQPHEFRAEVSLDLFEPPPPPAPAAPPAPAPEPPKALKTPPPVKETPKPKPEPKPEPAAKPAPEPSPAPVPAPSEPAPAETATAANLASPSNGEPSDKPTLSGPNVNRARDRYLARVRSRIERAKRYPAAARTGEGQEGRVKVRITISASGDLGSAQVVKSSGYELLDRAALEAVERAAPFGPLPPELGESFTVTVPIDFTIPRR